MTPESRHEMAHQLVARARRALRAQRAMQADRLLRHAQYHLAVASRPEPKLAARIGLARRALSEDGGCAEIASRL